MVIKYFIPSHKIPLTTRILEKATFKGILELTRKGIQVEGRENLYRILNHKSIY